MKTKIPGWGRMVLLLIPIQIAVVLGFAWVLNEDDAVASSAEHGIERPVESVTGEPLAPRHITQAAEEERPQPAPRVQASASAPPVDEPQSPDSPQPPASTPAPTPPVQAVAVVNVEPTSSTPEPEAPVAPQAPEPQVIPVAAPPEPQPIIQPLQEPASTRTIKIGAYISGQSIRVLEDYENMVGRHQDVFHYFRAWGPRLDSSLPRDLVARGTTPMITWEPFGYSLDGMIQGQYDQYIRGYAEDLSRIPGTVYLRPLHEMNGDWYPWGAGNNGNTPAKFKEAFRHVSSLVKSVATNVEIIWAPNHVSSSDGSARSIPQYYPGDEYVDQVAIDGYNWGNSWASFDRVFGPAYSEITAITSKPIMIGETSSAESGGNKAQWITDAFDSIAKDYPRITTVLWFNSDKERDWRVSSSNSSLEAFRDAISP